MKVLRLLTAAGLWFSLAAPRAMGQQPGAGDACDEAARLVASGEATDTHAWWARAHIVRCPDGPAAIAGRWRTAEDRPEALAQLRAWNYQIRDQRIAEAVLAAARDASRPTNVRLMALQTLVS